MVWNKKKQVDSLLRIPVGVPLMMGTRGGNENRRYISAVLLRSTPTLHNQETTFPDTVEEDEVFTPRGSGFSWHSWERGTVLKMGRKSKSVNGKPPTHSIQLATRQPEWWQTSLQLLEGRLKVSSLGKRTRPRERKALLTCGIVPVKQLGPHLITLLWRPLADKPHPDTQDSKSAFWCLYSYTWTDS